MGIKQRWNMGKKKNQMYITNENCSFIALNILTRGYDCTLLVPITSFTSNTTLLTYTRIESVDLGAILPTHTESKLASIIRQLSFLSENELRIITDSSTGLGVYRLGWLDWERWIIPLPLLSLGHSTSESGRGVSWERVGFESVWDVNKFDLDRPNKSRTFQRLG